MSTEDESKYIYCHGEGDKFPRGEFTRKDGRWIHNVKDPHFTNGEPIDENETNPVLPGAPADPPE